MRLFHFSEDPDITEFVPRGDGWMLVSHDIEVPIAMEALAGDLVDALCRDGVEVRIMPDLAPRWGAWEHTFHFSGIRLRYARNWPGNAPPPPGAARAA